MSITRVLLTNLGAMLLGALALVPGIISMHRRLVYWRSAALTDPLTELANRRAILRYLRRHAPDGRTSVIMLDVDGLKKVNTEYGHGAGDDLLRALAQRISELGALPVPLVGRLGGDEFVLIVDADTADDVRTVAEAVHAKVTGTRVSLGYGRWTDLRASLGVAVGVTGVQPRLLLHQADAAMYRSKAAGGGVHVHDRAAALAVPNRPRVRQRDRHTPVSEPNGVAR
ncbi:hypothetical protein GCM10010123_19750 [Pilimelia anulata]|uniref:GGDEF domain-containing protein n=1 Tax=Pilimelia anulata TaxID=53371 RepID=A0A8J3B5R3_9ACTN|nr:GGDEF domain-containing protein [Pilimelia anulata]GGJ89979.1 hypothetical protein GCM10010123_19750 [Pilimelia anulata]